MPQRLYAMVMAVGMAGSSLAAAGIPFPDALKEANVTLTSISDGHSESLMLGNGDLYGIVWEKDGGLFMRVTKNDVWDARVDTSKDGPLPKVDVHTGKVTGSTGAPPSYKLPYPHPRCAAALRIGLGGQEEGGRWACIRGAPQHRFASAADGSTATMQVGGARGASTGYKVTLSEATHASAVQLRFRGSANASYYVNVYDKDNRNILATGWKPSPAELTEIDLPIKPQPVRHVEVYTMTSDGKTAENHVESLRLEHEGEKVEIALPPESAPLEATLDLRRAVAMFKQDDGTTTTVRVLADRNVVLLRCAGPVRIEEITAATLPSAETGQTDGVAWLHMRLPGDVDYQGMEYALAVAGKGELKAVSLVTSFDAEKTDVRDAAVALAKRTIAGEEADLIAAHERAWEDFWSRSGIELADKDMQRWWYRLLYFAKTVCEPGAAPVALMPPLATDVTPWHADIHHNYNAWQAFWPLPAANQSELTDPWISYVDDMLPRFKFLAKETYDIDGVFMPISSFLHEPDPAVCKSNNQRQMSMNPWGLTIGMLGMTIQSMWHRHLCDPDPEYMKEKIYPTLREGARFYVSFIQQCKKDDSGKVLLGPSYSPEHGPMGISNCPFDIAYVHYTLDAFIRAAGELDEDRELAAKCRTMKDLLPEYPVAPDADGKPVVVDWQGCKYRQIGQHNIEVPASPVFPGDQVTWFSAESDKELFRRTIRDTRHTGANSHIIFNIAKARLSMPEAVDDAKAFFIPRTLPNGFIRMPWAHGTFMQEMIGVVGLVDELLMQSVGDIIRVFPCWPDDVDARFSRLRAQGGFLVTAEQKDGEVVRLEVTSTVGGTLRLLSPWEGITAGGKVITPDERGIVTIETEAGEVITFGNQK